MHWVVLYFLTFEYNTVGFRYVQLKLPRALFAPLSSFILTRNGLQTARESFRDPEVLRRLKFATTPMTHPGKNPNFSKKKFLKIFLEFFFIRFFRHKKRKMGADGPQDNFLFKIKRKRLLIYRWANQKFWRLSRFFQFSFLDQIT